MRVPVINTKKLRESIGELIEIIPSRSMYKIVLESIDRSMEDLVDTIGEVDPLMSKVPLEEWGDSFRRFGEREAYYYKAFLDSEDRDVVDAPLFEGDYSGFEFEDPPKYPDIETPWRLANELATIVASSGGSQDDLDDIESRFNKNIVTFWSEAESLLEAERDKFAAEAGGDEPEGEASGRRYGFWPLLAIAAVSAVGMFGAAAGYAAAKEKDVGQYIDQAPWEKHKKRAVDVGVGIGAGALIALLLLRRK